MTLAQAPPAMNEAVVAPLWPWLMPQEGGWRKERKPLPQPPFMAVVESPARKKAGGLDRLFAVQGQGGNVGGGDGDGSGIKRAEKRRRREVVGSILVNDLRCVMKGFAN